MRILVVSPVFPYPLIKGIKIRLFNIVRQLAREHEVHLAAMAQSEDPVDCPELEAAGARLTRLPPPLQVWDPTRRTGVAEDLAHAAIKVLSSRPNLVRIHSTPEVERAVAELAGNPFDLAFCFRTYLYPLVARIAGERPILVDFDDVEHVKFAAQSSHTVGRLTAFLDRVESRKLHGWENWIARGATAAFVAAEEDRVHFPPTARERIHALPNGVQFAVDDAPRAAEVPSRLLLLGDMGYLPNADSALHFCDLILPRIREQVPEVEVAIVGNHPGAEVLALGRRPGVTVTGFVPEVAPWFQSAAMLVVPIRFGGGTRIKILEALSWRRAVVATSAGAAGLGAESGKHLVIADGDVEFARAVIELLRDPARRRDLGAAGGEWARQRYSWDRIGDRLLEVIARTAAASGRA